MSITLTGSDKPTTMTKDEIIHFLYNLRIGQCLEEPEKEVVQINDREGWLCCHNDLRDKDHLDVEELRRDPTGLTCRWTSPFLQDVQKAVHELWPGEDF